MTDGLSLTNVELIKRLLPYRQKIAFLDSSAIVKGQLQDQ